MLVRVLQYPLSLSFGHFCEVVDGGLRLSFVALEFLACLGELPGVIVGFLIYFLDFLMRTGEFCGKLCDFIV